MQAMEISHSDLIQGSYVVQLTLVLSLGPSLISSPQGAVILKREEQGHSVWQTEISERGNRQLFLPRHRDEISRDGSGDGSGDPAPREVIRHMGRQNHLAKPVIRPLYLMKNNSGQGQTLL